MHGARSGCTWGACGWWRCRPQRRPTSAPSSRTLLSGWLRRARRSRRRGTWPQSPRDWQPPDPPSPRRAEPRRAETSRHRWGRGPPNQTKQGQRARRHMARREAVGSGRREGGSARPHAFGPGRGLGHLCMHARARAPHHRVGRCRPMPHMCNKRAPSCTLLLLHADRPGPDDQALARCAYCSRLGGRRMCLEAVAAPLHAAYGLCGRPPPCSETGASRLPTSNHANRQRLLALHARPSTYCKEECLERSTNKGRKKAICGGGNYNHHLHAHAHTRARAHILEPQHAEWEQV